MRNDSQNTEAPDRRKKGPRLRIELNRLDGGRTIYAGCHTLPLEKGKRVEAFIAELQAELLREQADAATSRLAS